jgi:hypothetical protein
VLTEDRVITAVCEELERRGYEIVRAAAATERGDDIVASRRNERLVIEAKGAGSSKAGTARYGKEFSSGQVFDHVAKAVLKALRVAAAGNDRAGIALPDNETHRSEVERISPVLTEVGIAVFWVADEAAVSIDAPWPL